MSQSPLSPTLADRNLLFGILALQMDFITANALIAAMQTWVFHKAKPLGQILVEQGVLAADTHTLLDALVQKQLAQHGHDAQKSLAAISSIGPVRQSLQQIADAEVRASLALIATGPANEQEGIPTRPILVEPAVTAGLRFRVLRPHAKGGLGEVFVALDEELRREVALKEIQGKHADHPESRTRFVREAEITGGLEHPGIVPVYGLGQYADGRPFYAMRFIRGDSLLHALRRFHGADKAGRDSGERLLELRQLLGRFVAVCNAVGYAHSRGVLHRDLKPANVMLGNYGETLVVDWGLARVFQQPEEIKDGAELPLPTLAGGDSNLTQAGRVLGTPAYMSPEQAAGRLDQMGPATDVYSLGTTLYELLAGQVPFPDKQLDEVLHKIQHGEFPPPCKVKPQVPPALEAICLKAMALKSNDRYPSARALADDVEHWLADEPVAAYAEPWRLRLGRWVRRHKGLVGSTVAAGVVVLTVAVAYVLIATARLAEAEARQRAEDRDRDAKEMVQLRNQAEVERGRAEEERSRADRFAYFLRMNFAQRAWQEANVGRMDELLQLGRPEHTSHVDFRDFEWYYLQRVRHNHQVTLRGHTYPVTGVAFSPDGQLLASSSWDGTVKIWDPATGRVLRTLQGHSQQVTSVAFSPDGKTLASGAGQPRRRGEVKVWDPATGQERFRLPDQPAPVHGIAFSPDGKRLALALGDHLDPKKPCEVKVWDLASRAEAFMLTGHTACVRSVAFNHDGTRLASGGDDKSVRVWDLVTRKQDLLLIGQQGLITAVAFSPDGTRLASTSSFPTVMVWDAATGKPLQTLRGHAVGVNAVSWYHDGKFLATAGQDQVVRGWDAATGAADFVLRGHTGGVSSVAFHPKEWRLATAGEERTVKIWQLGGDQEAFALKGHKGDVMAVAFSPDGRHLVSAGDEGTVKVWDPDRSRSLRTIRVAEQGVHSVAYSPVSQRLASGGKDGQIKVWDAETGQERLTIAAHAGAVACLAYSPDGQHLASAGDDRTVKIWDSSGKELLILGRPGRAVMGIAFHPKGHHLAAADKANYVRVWDTTTGREVYTIKASNWVSSVAYSPDGTRLAAGCYDQTVKVWDTLTGQEVHSLKGHKNHVLAVAFSPRGNRLVSASNDATIKVWDVATGQEALTLKPAGIAVGVAFSPDGRRLASASHGRIIQIWDARPLPDEPGSAAPPVPEKPVPLQPDPKRPGTLATEHRELAVLPAPGKVTLGKLDEWDLSGGIFVCRDVARERDQYAAWIHAMYDADRLYLLARFRDPTPLNNPGQTATDDGWQGDSLQVRFRFPGSDRAAHLLAWQGKDGGNLIDLRYGKFFRIDPENPPHDRGARQVLQRDADPKGYTQEIALPWKLLTQGQRPPQPGDRFAMTLQANFTLGTQQRVMVVDLFRPDSRPEDRVDTYNKPEVWGNAVLEAKGRISPRPVRLSDGREVPVKLVNGVPVVDWTGLDKGK